MDLPFRSLTEGRDSLSVSWTSAEESKKAALPARLIAVFVLYLEPSTSQGRQPALPIEEGQGERRKRMSKP